MKRIVLLATLALWSDSTLAQSPERLIRYAVPGPALSPPGAVWLIWNTGFNLTALRQPATSIILNLPGQSESVVNLKHFEPREGYVYVDVDGDGQPDPVADPSTSPAGYSWRWYGKSDTWTVALTLHRGVLAGRISGTEVQFAIEPSDNGLTWMGRVNPEYWRMHDGDLGPGEAAIDQSRAMQPLPPAATPSQPPPAPWDATCSGAVSGTEQVIDVLAMYTQRTLQVNGNSETAVQATVQAAIDDANQSLRNSGVASVSFALRSVEYMPGDYDYIPSSIALQNFGGWRNLAVPPFVDFPGNPYVLSRRNALGADVVALARTIGDVCGASETQHVRTQGFVREPGASFEQFAYLVFNPECNTERFSLAHELGHLLGLEHDPRNSSVATGAVAGQPACPWSYGHRHAGEPYDPLRFRTVMSYWEPGVSSPGVRGPGGCGGVSGCPVIDAYSTPTLEWTGHSGLLPVGSYAGASPIGVAAQTAQLEAANGADTIVRLAPIVASFRDEPDVMFAHGFQ